MTKNLQIKTSLRQLRNHLESAFIALALTCFALPPSAQAVSPAPKGGYPGGNTAEGQNALLSLTTGTYNTALGMLSLQSNKVGNFNTATGAFALFSNSTGNGNIALGASAGINLTAGDNNIDIGNDGVAGESGMIRIGDPDIHESVFLAGIIPMTPEAPIQAVLVDPSTG